MANVTKEQVADYLKGLVGAYGPSPSIIDATIYTRSSSLPVTPADAIRVFGANNWGEVMTAYGRYLAASKKDSDKQESNISVKEEPEIEHHGYYSKKYLLESLAEMYVEFGGHFTAQKVRERAKRTTTPSYTTLSECFGPPKGWAQIVEENGLARKPTKQSYEIVLDDRPGIKSTIELKISAPGRLSEPITMEFTIR